MRQLKKLSVLSLAVAGLLGTIQSNAAVQDTAFFRALPMVIVWGADAAAEGAPTANPVASDFVLLGGATGTVGSDIITGNVFPVITGTLTPAPQAPVATAGSLVSVTGQVALPAGGGVLTDNAAVGVLNAADTMTAFGIQPATTVSFAANALKRSFYVASNAKFDLFAQSGAVAATGDFSALTAANISWSMAITPTGTDGALAFGANAQDPTTGGTGVAAATNLGAFTAATKVFGGGRKTALTNGGVAAQSVRFDVTYGLVGGYNFALGAGTVSVPVTYTVYNP
jgi:hypothetical protein